MKKFLFLILISILTLQNVMSQKDTTKTDKTIEFRKVSRDNFIVQPQKIENNTTNETTPTENQQTSNKSNKVVIPDKIEAKDVESNSKAIWSVPYSTTFDEVTDWLVSGNLPTRLWQIGVQYNGDYGPQSGHSGQICAGTRLNANYVNNANENIISPTISLAGTTNPRLSFWMDMECENNNDYGAIYIRKNNSTFYYLISASDFEQNRPNSGNAWTGTQPTGDWQQVFLDLFSITNPGLAPITSSDSIKVMFKFVSNNSVSNYPGWYIDDFEVYNMKDTTTIVKHQHRKSLVVT